MLSSAKRFADLKHSLESNPSFNVEVKHEKEYLVLFDRHPALRTARLSVAYALRAT